MKLSQFNFNLPVEQVALYPHSFEREYVEEDGTKGTFSVIRRDESRLMVVHKQSQKIDMYHTDKKGKEIEGDFIQFKDALNYFSEGDTFILNNSRIFPARLFGTKEKTDAKIEVFLLRELNEEMRLWDVLVEPARKIRIGNKLFFDDSGTMVAEVIDNTTSRGRTLRFLYDCPHDEFKADLFALGSAPLPRYIIDHKGPKLDSKGKPMKDEKGNVIMDFDRPVTPEDMDNFQSIFATEEGSVTAPATSLHFTREMMKRMEIIGIETAFITHHCGLGIYNTIEVEDLTNQNLYSEQMNIPLQAL